MQIIVVLMIGCRCTVKRRLALTIHVKTTADQILSSTTIW
jgi:hypothetical protein